MPRKDITARVDIITKGMETRTMLPGVMTKVFWYFGSHAVVRQAGIDIWVGRLDLAHGRNLVTTSNWLYSLVF